MSIASSPETSPIGDDEQSAERAHDAIAILIQGYETLTAPGQVTVPDGKAQLFWEMFGWWTWITRSCRVVSQLHRAGLGHESSPNARSIMEHTLVLQWVLDVGEDALDALEEHRQNNRRKMLNTLRDAKWHIPDDITPATPKPEQPHRLLGMVGNFANICVAYEALQLYAVYRLLSQYVHPSAEGARLYIEPDGALHTGPVLQTHSRLIQTAMCLIQATRCINTLVGDEQLDKALTNAQERFGQPVGQWSRRKTQGSAEPA